MRLTDVDKGEIWSLHKLGYINVEISNQLNISLNTVCHWINKMYNTGNMKNKIVETRKGKLTLNQVYNIITTITSKNCSINKLIEELKLDVSSSTIKNILKKTRHRFGNSIKKPFLTDKHREDRVNWCTLNFFINTYLIEFSDEMTIWKDKNSSRVWYKIGNKKIDYRRPHSKKYNVWGMINSDGEFYYCIFEENMDSYLYENILFTNILPLHKEGNYFQQDNNSSHKAKNIKEFFKDYDINILPWPSNSPDLNLIENIWGLIKNKMSKIENLTNDNFLTNLEESLKSIKNETIINLYDSMQKRMDLVIINKGYPTKY